MKFHSTCSTLITLVFCAGALSAQDSPTESSTLAVLPIEVLTSHPGGSELADTIYEATLSTLVSIDGVQVLDGEMVSPFVDAGLSSEEIAQALGIAIVVEGSISARTRDGTFWLELETHALGYSGSQGGVVGFLDPTRTHLTICTSESTPIDMDAEALLAYMLSGMVEVIEHLLFQKPRGSANPCASVDRQL